MKNMNSYIQVLATTTFDVCLNVTVCPVLFPFGLHIKVLQSPHQQKWLLINCNWPRYCSDQHGSVHRVVPLSCSTTWHAADCSVQGMQRLVYRHLCTLGFSLSLPKPLSHGKMEATVLCRVFSSVGGKLNICGLVRAFQMSFRSG